MNTYRTKDMGEAAGLRSNGMNIIDIERVGGVCWFIFSDRENCEELAKKYYFGDLGVSAREYKQNLDQLKSLVHA